MLSGSTSQVMGRDMTDDGHRAHFLRKVLVDGGIRREHGLLSVWGAAIHWLSSLIHHNASILWRET